MAYDPESSRDLWQQATRLAPPQGSEPERAIALLKQALEKDPRNVFAYSSLARLYLALGALEKAEESCTTGMAVRYLPPELATILGHVQDPLAQKSDDFKFYRFLIRLKQGDRPAAEALLKDLKAYSDEYGKGHYDEAVKRLSSDSSEKSASNSAQNAESTTVWRSIWGEHAFRAQVDLSLKYPGKERVTSGENAVRCLKCDTATPLVPCLNCGSSAYDFGLGTDRVVGLFCSKCRRGFTYVRCEQCSTENPITHETILHRGTEKKGGCFVATAVFGTPNAPEVAVLSAFRDRYLMTTVLGCRFVRAYYRISPALAARLERSRVAKTIVREGVILPLVRLVKVCWRFQNVSKTPPPVN